MRNISNKTLAIALAALFIAALGVLSFLNSSTGGDEMEPILIVTSTPTESIYGDGWWNEIPTPFDVVPDPQRATPSP